jgi:hypothetical protein
VLSQTVVTGRSTSVQNMVPLQLRSMQSSSMQEIDVPEQAPKSQ